MLSLRTLSLGLVVLGITGYSAHPHTDSPQTHDLYSFRLHATSRAPRATGLGRIKLAWSPFGLAMTADGFVKYDLSLSFDGLIPRTRLPEGTGYVAWILSPSLDRIEKLGAIVESETIENHLDSWNKFLVVVSMERDPDGVAALSGPVVLRGVSPSGLMESFQSHELFTDVPD